MRKRRNGMILITTMLIVVIIVMLIAMITNSAYNSFKIGSGYSDGEQAYYAAVSGLEYARSRFSLNGNWMEKLYSHQTECLNSEDPDRPGGYSIRVFEKAGIVTGYLGMEPRSIRSMFIIRFISTNQSPSAPNLAASSEFVDWFGIKRQIRSLSCNNMSGTTPITCISGSGKEKQLPSNYAFISVQGVCKNSVKYAEALLSNGGSINFSGSSLSRGNIDVDLKGANPKFVIDSQNSSGENNIRTLNNISVTGPYTNCFVMERPGKAYADRFIVNQQDVLESDEIKNFKLDKNNTSTLALLNSPSLKDEITFSNLYSAQNNEPPPNDGTPPPTGDSTNDKTNIESGAYVFDGTKWLKYNCTFSTKEGADRTAPVITDKKALENPYPEMFIVKDGKPYVNINKKREIEGSVFIGAVDKIKDLLNPVAKEEQNTDSSPVATEYIIKTSDLSPIHRPTVVFAKNSALIVGKEDSSSDFILQGSLVGKGKLLVNGDVYMQGGSYFETEPNSGVAVYAEKNVNIISATAGDVEGLPAASAYAWKQFYDSNNGVIKLDSDDPSDTTYLTKAAKELLKCKTSDGGVTFDAFLEERGCKALEDRLKFAVAFISQNSAIDSGTSDSPVAGTVTTKNYTTGTLSTELLSDSDTLRSWDWKGNMQDNPLMNSIGTDPISWNNGYYPHSTVKYSPYQRRLNPEKAFPRWLSLTDKNIADENLENAGDYNWWDNPNPLRSNFLLSFDYIKKGQNYDSFSENTLSKNKADQDYIQIWIHEVGSSSEPNDLFILLPKVSGSIKPQARYGYDRECEFYGGRTYIREKFASLDSEAVSIGAEGKININFKKVFEKLDSAVMKKVNSFSGNTLHYNNVPDDWNHYYNNSYSASAYKYMKEALERCSYFKWDKTLSLEIDGNKIVGLSQNSAYSDTLQAKDSMILKESADGTGLILPNRNNTNVKGFIFAREGNFNVNIGEGGLAILGGIVSYNGKINVSAGSFNLKYDPNYMQFVNASGIKTSYLYQNVLSP